jgi:hypothetical protein
MPVAIDPGLPVRAVFLDAGGVQRQRMVLQPEAFFSCNRMLAAFDVVVKKLFHPTAIHAHHVVVVMAFVQLIDGLA